MRSYICSLFVGVACVISGFTLAGGYTNEQEDLGALSSGRIPLQVSKDGKWIVHLDSDSILHRTKVGDANVDQKVMLFNVPLAISASQDAQKVAVFDGVCIKFVNFSEQVNSVRKIKSACTMAQGIKQTILDPGEHYFDTAAIALSNDAKQLAFPRLDSELKTASINIIDANTEELFASIPAQGNILHLQFLDNDTKLLVVQAIMGEVWEGGNGPSDMQFAIWDLKKHELFSFFHSDKSSPLVLDDFLWSFSGLSGDLATIKPQVELRGNREKDTPISILRFNVKQCRMQPAISFVVKQDESQGNYLFEMASDPAGRWLATIEANTLLVRSFTSGEILYQEHLTKVIRSLSVSTDGNTLYGVEAGESEVIGDVTYYRGGGKVVQFPLDKVLAGLPEPKTQNWNDSVCKIENEAANARHIELATKPAVKLYQVILGGANVDNVGSFQPYNCYSDPNASYVYAGGEGANSNMWGLSDDGSLWVDRDKELEQLNPITGKRLRNIPTPRTETLCSFPLFAKQKFLNLVGDKVLAVPFLKAPDEAPLEFAKLAGSTPTTVVSRGDYVGILWKEAKEEGNEIPVLYDAVSGKVIQEFQPLVDVDEFSFGYTVPLTELKVGSYQWDLSFMGSVRAQFKSPETSQLSTVLWDGFSFGAAKPAASVQSSLPARVFNFGGGKALFFKENTAVFYDAASKRKLISVSLSGVIGAQWSEKDHLLFIETLPAPPESAESRWLLHAYKIE